MKIKKIKPKVQKTKSKMVKIPREKIHLTLQVLYFIEDSTQYRYKSLSSVVNYLQSL